MKKILFIIGILSSVYAQSQVPQISVTVPSITTLKNYVGNANRIYVSATNEDYSICSACVVNEYNILSGAGGRKWVKTSFSDSSVLSISNVGIINLKSYGVIGDGVTNNTSRIQSAIDFASSMNYKIYVPKGVYNIVPSTSKLSEAGTLNVAFVMRSNMHIIAEAGAVFRIANNISTDALPKMMAMFFTNDTISNVSFEGLTFDMNGQNNPISPNRPTSYNRFDQAPIFVSGTINGIAASMGNVLVDGCYFINNPGVCNIVVAQSNSLNVNLGKRWVIRNNKFLNNGLDTDDHTAIFAWADYVECYGNVFENPLKFRAIGLTGGNTAYEVHGSGHSFHNNYVKNYYRGIWISSNLTHETNNTDIYGNTFDSCAFYGVDVFRTASTLGTIRGVKIHHNFFNFDDYSYVNGTAPTQKVAFQIACEYAVSDIEVTDNTATKTGTNIGSSFTTISPQSIPNQAYDQIKIEGNKASGFVNGSFIRTNATNGLGYISIKRNTWINNTPSTIFTIPIGNFVDAVSQIKTLEIEGNTHIDTRTTPLFQNGNYLSGSFYNLHYNALSESYKGLSGTYYSEAGVTVVNRTGGETDGLSVHITGDQSKNGNLIMNGSAPLTINSVTSSDGKMLFTNQANTQGFNVGLTGATTGDLVIANKYLSTSSLTISKANDYATFVGRVAGANGVSSSDFVTVSQLNAKIISGTVIIDFAPTNAQTSSEISFTVSGVVAGDIVVITKADGSAEANAIVNARGSASNTITARFLNASTSSIDPLSASYNYRVVK